MSGNEMYKSHNLAIQIKNVAQQKNITIKKMLDDCNLGSNTMSALYHGKAIAFDSLARIADYMGVSVDYLLGRTNTASDLSTQEQSIIDAYRAVSAQGREYILQQVTIAQEIYKNSNSVSNMEAQIG